MSVVGKPDYRIEQFEGGSIRIVAPRELVTPNVWNGHHWRLKDRITQEWQQVLQVCALTSRVEVDRARIRRRVTVTRFTPSGRNWIRDDDNLRFAVKPLLDALKRRGHITNDSRPWLELPTPLQDVSPDRRYWTAILIEPLGEPVRTPRSKGRAGQGRAGQGFSRGAPGMSVRRPLEARFWAKVQRGPVEACWPWTGATSKKTSAHYGIIRADGPSRKILLAHRVALFLLTGEMPDGMDACHHCDNPICCNPTHLFWGTHRENMKDYARKYGRVAVEKRPPPPRPIFEALDALEAVS